MGKREDANIKFGPLVLKCHKCKNAPVFRFDNEDEPVDVLCATCEYYEIGETIIESIEEWNSQQLIKFKDDEEQNIMSFKEYYEEVKKNNNTNDAGFAQLGFIAGCEETHRQYKLAVEELEIMAERDYDGEISEIVEFSKSILNRIIK